MTIFEGNHNGPNFKGRRNTRSRHNIVVDAHAGPKSVEFVLPNTPETWALLMEGLGKAMASGDQYLILVARDAKNAPRRFVIQTHPGKRRRHIVRTTP